MVNFFLPCPELTSGNEHSLFELTNVKLHSAELLFCKNTFKMYKYFCLKTHSCLCRVRDTVKVVTKKDDILLIQSQRYPSKYCFHTDMIISLRNS